MTPRRIRSVAVPLSATATAAVAAVLGWVTLTDVAMRGWVLAAYATAVVVAGAATAAAVAAVARGQVEAAFRAGMLTAGRRLHVVHGHHVPADPRAFARVRGVVVATAGALVVAAGVWLAPGATAGGQHDGTEAPWCFDRLDGQLTRVTCRPLREDARGDAAPTSCWLWRTRPGRSDTLARLDCDRVSA